jgi:signal transduction histidine kinase
MEYPIITSQQASGQNSRSYVHGGRRARGLIVAAILLFSQLLSADPQKAVKRVLIFNDFDSISSPGIATLDQAVAVGLADSPYNVELYKEDLDSVLFPDDASQHRFRDWFIRKYSERKPDLIITVGPASLRFMIESQENSFSNIPVIFCGTTAEMLGQLKPAAHFTGVWAVAEPEKTLIAALQTRPATRHVIVVGGLGKFDRAVEATARASFHKYESKYEFTYLVDLDMPSLFERLRHLPSDSIIYHTSLMLDAAGNHFVDAAQSVPLIVSAANAPIFVMDEVDLGQGTVGGYLVRWTADGRVAATMALRVLNGEKPQDIPIVKNDNNYLFDWRALNRWGIKEKDLPPGSTVLFREPSGWDRTKWLWFTALQVILGLSILAAYLHFSRKKLKLAQDAQLELSGLLINSQEKERSRLASELHDDFSQRLALLSLGLENAADELPESSAAVKRQLHELFESASELGADIHTVSHRLHSSTLESLGLVPGVSALCKEFTDRHGIEIDFSSSNIPRRVNHDVALCLFRIIQEGLQNFRKHSGVAKAEVKLWTAGDKILISVSDKGRGFNVKEMTNKAGLGIRSMEERARLLGGRFEIHSEPRRGTTIEACVPLQPATGEVKDESASSPGKVIHEN